MGCKKFTKMSTLVRLYKFKASNGWSDKSFTELLGLIKELLPELNELPKSLYEVKKSYAQSGYEL